LRKAATNLPNDLRQRFSSKDKLSDEDRTVILQVVNKTLAAFHPEPNPESKKKP